MRRKGIIVGSIVVLGLLVFFTSMEAAPFRMASNRWFV